MFACDAEQWEEAVRQFTAMGDKPDASAFQGMARYQYMRRKAEKAAKAPKPEPQAEPQPQEEPRQPNAAIKVRG